MSIQLSKWKTTLPITLAALLTACAPAHKNTYEHFLKDKVGDLRVTTYNINWGNGSWKIQNPKATIKAIDKTHADVVLLQETTKNWQRMMKKDLGKQYRYQHFVAHINGGGIAVLSKYPLQNLRIIQPPVGWYPAMLFNVRTKLGTVQILNVHLVPTMPLHRTPGFTKYSPPQTDDIRLKEISYFYHKLNARIPTLVGGDFNETMDGKGVRFLHKQGYTNVLSYVPRPNHTWHWKIAHVTLSSQYDHILYQGNHFRLAKAQVLHEGKSDHYPVVADFH